MPARHTADNSFAQCKSSSYLSCCDIGVAAKTQDTCCETRAADPLCTKPCTCRIESQRYLVELASVGKTVPNAAMTRRSTSASSVEMMDFNLFHLMSHNNRVRETYTEHAKRCLISPTPETTSPACRRFSASFISVRCPTATVSMNSPSASRLSFSHWGILSRMPSTTLPQTCYTCRVC